MESYFYELPASACAFRYIVAPLYSFILHNYDSYITCDSWWCTSCGWELWVNDLTWLVFINSNFYNLYIERTYDKFFFFCIWHFLLAGGLLRGTYQCVWGSSGKGEVRLTWPSPAIYFRDPLEKEISDAAFGYRTRDLSCNELLLNQLRYAVPW